MRVKQTDLLTTRINETGFLFQDHCCSIIDKDEGRNIYIKEFPFTFPKTNENKPGVFGSIDILALNIPKPEDRAFGIHPYIIFVIECKKSSENLKNWCFIKGNRGRRFSHTFFANTILKNNGRQFNGVPDFISNKQISFRLFEPTIISENDLVTRSFEVNNLLNSLNRNQQENIYNAALQSVRGVTCLEQKDPFVIDGLGLSLDFFNFDKDKGLKFLFLPVVVTTSNIYIAEFDPSLVKKGESKKINWRKKDWVLYDFGLPDYLQHGGRINNRGVFVVSDTYFEKFYHEIYPTTD